MTVTSHSLEADAAIQFMTASRKVDLAFRAVRNTNAGTGVGTQHAAALSQLDRALKELAEAQELFDATTSNRSGTSN